MNFNSALFSIVASETVAVCEHPGELMVHPNVEIPDAPMSSRRSSGTSRSPKISALFYPLEHAFRNKDMAILTSKDGSVYCEMTVDSITESYLWHGDTFYSDKPLEDKKGRSSFLMCLLLSCLIRNPSHYSETGIYLNTVTTSFEKASYVPKKEMASLCDCFYYDLKDEKASAMSADIQCKPFDSAVQNLVQQSVRTMNMTFPAEHLDEIGASKFADHLTKVFKNVTLSERAAETSSSSSSTAPESTGTFIRDCKYGQYEIGYEWTPEQMKRVRRIDFLDGFIPNETFEGLVKLADYDLNAVIDRMNTGASGVEAIGDNYINTILVGKPGTGKTTTAEALSATLGMPIYTVKNSKNTEEDTFEGMTKVVEGNFAFRSTPFLEAFEHGGILVLEEFNLADPGVMQGALGQAIEYPFMLMKDGYQEVYRHPMCIIISTMNTATQGAREPNEALTSRSPIAFVMDDPSDAEFISILESKGYTKKDCKAVYKAYKAIIKHLVDVAGSEEMTMQVTLRHCLGALKLMRIGYPIQKAIENTMIGSIAIKDLTLANEVKEAVIKTMRF